MHKIDIACIVDDDPIFVFATKRIMQIANFCESLLVFHNGKEAFDSLSAIVKTGEKIPEVILLDLNMPVMDGWQFLDEFTKITIDKPITIFIVTSSVDPQDFIKANTYKDINNYIIKPITPDVLKDILVNFNQN